MLGLVLGGEFISFSSMGLSIGLSFFCIWVIREQVFEFFRWFVV